MRFGSKRFAKFPLCQVMDQGKWLKMPHIARLENYMLKSSLRHFPVTDDALLWKYVCRAASDLWLTKRTWIQDAEDRAISVLIEQSLLPSIRLDLFPKSTIDVFVTVLENDGIEGCVAAGAIASSTALADAGIEMLGLVTSCAASTIKQSGTPTLYLDPTAEESRHANGTITLACMPALGTVTNVWQTGTMTSSEAMQVRTTFFVGLEISQQPFLISVWTHA
jgi:hypothetical protein